ncbi:hypothetical protein HYU11_04220 [Candidatus Woesearchaeota archaeon]|nr:hypothetical protein [Candidatus Woesearchaeota archaeon]
MRKEVLSSFLTEAQEVRAELGIALKDIYEEFDEHLEAINQSTEEVQANHEYLCRLDCKIDRLGERVEQIALTLKNAGMNFEEARIEDIKLSEKEKDVFLVMYTADKMLSYRDISSGIRESEFLVRGHITNMIHKGIPIKKKYINNEVRMHLDVRFREHQAKTNFLGISQKTVREFG